MTEGRLLPGVHSPHARGRRINAEGLAHGLDVPRAHGGSTFHDDVHAYVGPRSPARRGRTLLP
eukprot:13685359-Alexandrium_andersonii.AAC.1